MSAQTKRMQLSRDQRAVLEAVYAIEKLPDASLRERNARRRLYRETLRELGQLSNRELSDLGLHRSMIRRVAWQAAYEA